MEKKAFLLGCNSAGLKHCETDAALMQQALRLHGYEVTLIEQPEQKAPYWKLLEHLQTFLNTCHKEDTLIFYFAGHSLNEGGAFKFILADDVNNANNQLLVAILLNLLRQCQAADKLLIFDCCRAGKIAADYNWNEEAGEYFRIFTATSSKATALETDEDTGGGLFTSWIYRALMTEAGKLTDPDGYLRINRLDEHIRRQADNHRSPQGRLAPEPNLYGSTARNIVLTDRISVQSNPTTGYPRPAIRELKELLALHQPTATQIQHGFDACRRQSDPAIRSYPTDDMNRLVDYLDGLYYRSGNRLPLPLVSFVASLSEALGNPPDVCAWLERLTDWLGQHTDVKPEELAGAGDERGPAASEQTPYLLLEIAPQTGSQTYHVYCYWQDDRGEQQPIGLYDEIALNAIPQILEKLLDEKTESRPCLEFFLPKALLTENETLAQLEQLQRPRPLPVEYPLGLRCWERLRRKGVKKTEECGYDLLKGYWKKYAGCFNRPLTRRCADWLKMENKGDYIDWIHSQDPFIGLHFPISPPYLDELLDAGAAIVLWPRRAMLSEAMQTVLDRYFSDCCLNELPEALRQVRENKFVKSQGISTGDLSLLWDDPNRVPEQADVPLDDVPLAFPT